MIRLVSRGSAAHKLAISAVALLMCASAPVAAAKEPLVSWSSIAAPPGRFGHAMLALQGGRVVVLGGSVSETELAGSILHYNDTSNSWQAVPTTGWTPRFGMAATVLDDDTILVVGGNSTNGAVADNVVFSKDAGRTWSPYAAPGLPVRFGAQLVQVVSKPQKPIYLLGGSIDGVPTLDIHVSYDFGKNWGTTSTSGWVGRTDFKAIATHNGDVLALGGKATGGNYLSSMQMLAAESNVWTTSSVALTPRIDFAAVELLNGSVVVIGGHDGTGPRNDTWFTNDTDTYESWYSLDTADGSVEFIPRSGHAAVVVRKSTGHVKDGDVMVVGGNTATGLAANAFKWECPLESCKAYSPPYCYITGWEAVHECKIARGNFAFTCDDPTFEDYRRCGADEVYDGHDCVRICSAGEREFPLL